MPKAYKTVGQSAPAANTDTTVYTVPASTQFVCSTITVCNRHAETITAYRVAVVPSGATLANQHYILYDRLIDGRETLSHTLGLALSAGDRIIVRATTTNLSFSIFGVEIT